MVCDVREPASFRHNFGCISAETSQHGPTRVPVLEGEGVPVCPVGPEHTGVAGGVELLAEADPVDGGEFLGDGLDVLRSQCHQVFETDLTGC